MHTSFYRDFTNLLGPSVHNLNTICIGLEQIVNKNYTQPAALSIRWATQDPVNDAKRARRYAINLFLVAAVDAIENYVHSISSFEYLITQKVQTNIKNADGIREEVQELFQEIKGNSAIKPYWLPAIKLLIAWRNILVHKSVAKTVLLLRDKKALIDAKDEIKDLHAQIDIVDTISHFEKKENPTLKDFSTLYTMLLKAFKEFDKTIAEKITDDATLELIKSNFADIGYEQLKITASNKIIKLAKYCKVDPKDYKDKDKKKQAKLEDDLKQKALIALGDAGFNKLIAKRPKAASKIKHYCQTNCIPFDGDTALERLSVR